MRRRRGARAACESTAATKSGWRRRRVTEPAAVLACREVMRRASLSFRARSKLCCSGGAVCVSSGLNVEREGAVLGCCATRRWSLGHMLAIMVVLGGFQDGRGGVPSGGNPTRERARASHGFEPRVGNGGRSIRGAQALDFNVNEMKLLPIVITRACNRLGRVRGRLLL